ncbi:putative ADP-ribose diphosphatase [Vibrio nigripulchritudo MADA3029]|uniref:NUDIX hydrolase n=1 Tax=Vibrio nigripulchritudo TaxID=28173 RepID=UPI0003B18489|nr:NUDIX hydrolase [Vibrio nigripulchritudo]CCN49784.1 putative ADP-ribose diphosphatase [Vibrio nigripulchritudo MADA3020]CCN54733.1 putative ADP-ribose diphosphatase [Vibrio nigripulchritudo MADA3021]CCN61703.1 putative ADP-ribose diphosphatase [Vibrio nigripulchritudo MADA3029]
MSRTIHSWKNISLCEEDLNLPTGKPITHTTIVHPGAAVILPILPDNRILLIRQYRPSLKKWILEAPAGTKEPDESPEYCAKRELEEETGYSAGSWHSLGQVTPLAGFCDEIQHLYVAKDLKKTDRLSCDDDEVIELLPHSLEDIENAIRNDELTDAKTIASIYKAKLCGLL